MAGAQRIVPGFPFPFYVNETATKQRIYPGAYVNETVAGGTTFNQSVLASCSPIASLVRQTGKLVLASSSPVASLTRQNSKPLQAASSPIAALVKQTGKVLQASSSPAASLIRQDGKILQANSSPVATIVRQTGKPLQASTSPVATLTAIKVILKTLQAICSPIASLLRSTGKPLAASTSPTTSLVRRPGKALQAVTAPLAALRRATGKGLQGIAIAIGTLATQFTSGGVAIDPLKWIRPLARIRLLKPARVRRIKVTARVRMIIAQRGVVKKFSPTTPAGRPDCTIDFGSILSGALTPGVTVNSCAVTCAIHPKSNVADPLASTRLDGSPALSGGRYVTQYFAIGGVAGASYILSYLPTLSNGTKEPIDAILEVNAYNDVGT